MCKELKIYIMCKELKIYVTFINSAFFSMFTEKKRIEVDTILKRRTPIWNSFLLLKRKERMTKMHMTAFFLDLYWGTFLLDLIEGEFPFDVLHMVLCFLV